MEIYSPEQIAQHYKAMGESVSLINAIVSGQEMASDSDDNKKATVLRNVDHLKLMRVKDFWTTQDMTAVDAAITAGETYVG